MFTVKNAMIEVLFKSKSLIEAMQPLSREERVIFLQTFALIKSKLDGAYDSFNTQDNGQWVLQKANTLDYRNINPPKDEARPASTIDYSGREPKVTVHDKDAYTRPGKVKKPWHGASKMKPRPPASGVRVEDILPPSATETKKSEEDEKKIKEIKEKFSAEEIKKNPDPAKINTKIAVKDLKVKKQLKN